MCGGGGGASCWFGPFKIFPKIYDYVSAETSAFIIVCMAISYSIQYDYVYLLK